MLIHPQSNKCTCFRNFLHSNSDCVRNTKIIFSHSQAKAMSDEDKILDKLLFRIPNLQYVTRKLWDIGVH